MFFASLLGKFWPEIALAIVAALVVGYIAILKTEVSHYKAKAETIQAQYDAAVAKAKSDLDTLEATNKQLSANIADTEKAWSKAQAENLKYFQDKIKNDKELAALKLSLNAVRVFNESKNPGGANSQGSTDTNAPDDGKAGTAQASLADLLAVSAENDANHFRCIKQVEEWQDFWTGYVKNVSAVAQ